MNSGGGFTESFVEDAAIGWRIVHGLQSDCWLLVSSLIVKYRTPAEAPI